MAVVFGGSNYLPPGVYSENISGPQLAGNSSAPTAVAIFGDSQRYRTDIETIVIPADSSGTPVATQKLRRKGINQSTLVVSNTATGANYTLTTDYTLTTITNGTGTRDDEVTIKRVSGGAITAGTVVQVSYQYTDPNYFEVATFSDFDDIRDQYGAPFDAAGNINSELTLAAQIAKVNGANQLVLVAVDAAGATPTTSEYAAALAKLQEQPNVSIVVPAVGDSNVFSYVKSHVESQSAQYRERRAIVGLDGSTTAVSSSARKSAASALSSSRVALVSPATVSFYNSNTQQYVTIGGQYMAAAVAGLSVNQIPSMPLTRKVVNGFSDIPELMSENVKNDEAQSGLMVVERIPAGAIRVRHGVTTSTTSLLTREWSVVGQQDALSFRLRDYLDSGGLIGSIIDDLTLAAAKSAALNALESLVEDRVINAYTDLKARQLVNSPDVIEIRFSWRPSLPLNYISVKFSLDLSEGTVTEI